MEVQNNKIVIYGIPLLTTKGELCKLIRFLNPKVIIKDCYIHTPKQPKNHGSPRTCMAFVQVDSNESRDALIQFSQKGYAFTNCLGVTGYITLKHCFKMNANHVTEETWYKTRTDHQEAKERELNINTQSDTQFLCQASMVPNQLRSSNAACEPNRLGTSNAACELNRLGTSNDCRLEIEDVRSLKELAAEKAKWEKEKQGIMGYIKLLEETLKEKSPLLFVSELEMHELKQEEEELARTCESTRLLKKEAKEELDSIREQFEKFLEIS